MDLLRDSFFAASAMDGENKHLWAKGASLFIPQLNRLLDTTTSFDFQTVDISTFQNDESDTLAGLFNKFGSDKSACHNYHIVYSHIFNDLGVNSELSVLEIGLGTNNPELPSNMGANGRPGASLYAFREYLPNATIYGGDIDRDILFESERIKTGFVDQLESATFDALSSKFGCVQFDLIIDDGLHSIGANFNTLLFGLKNIKPNGWVVIEDIQTPNNWKCIDYILKNSPAYETYFVKTRRSYMYLVKRTT